MKSRRTRKRLDPNTIVLLKQIGIGVVVLGVVALIISGIWYGTRLSAVTIVQVEARGGETIDGAVVENLAQETLEGTYLGLVPRRFAWLYPKEEIVSRVEEVERVHNVTIDRVNGTELRISYDEYVPHALWCQKTEENNCLFVDAEGYAFAPAPDLSGGTFLRFVTAGREVELGRTFIEKESLNNLLELTLLLAEHSWYVSHIEIDQVDDAFLQIVGGGELKVAVTESPKKTVDNFLVILASDDFAHLEAGNFQYVDLRFGNKVFVNEELAGSKEEAASSTASSTVSL